MRKRWLAAPSNRPPHSASIMNPASVKSPWLSHETRLICAERASEESCLNDRRHRPPSPARRALPRALSGGICERRVLARCSLCSINADIGILALVQATQHHGNPRRDSSREMNRLQSKASISSNKYSLHFPHPGITTGRIDPDHSHDPF
jgi:hypothetical protein